MSEVERDVEKLMEEKAFGGRQGTRVLLIGAGIGAATGLAAAFLLNRRAAQHETDLNITPGDGIRLGLLVLGLLRSIVSLGDEK